MADIILSDPKGLLGGAELKNATVSVSITGYSSDLDGFGATVITGAEVQALGLEYMIMPNDSLELSDDGTISVLVNSMVGIKIPNTHSFDDESSTFKGAIFAGVSTGVLNVIITEEEAELNLVLSQI